MLSFEAVVMMVEHILYPNKSFRHMIDVSFGEMHLVNGSQAKIVDVELDDHFFHYFENRDTLMSTSRMRSMTKTRSYWSRHLDFFQLRQ